MWTRFAARTSIFRMMKTEIAARDRNAERGDDRVVNFLQFFERRLSLRGARLVRDDEQQPAGVDESCERRTHSVDQAQIPDAPRRFPFIARVVEHQLIDDAVTVEKERAVHGWIRTPKSGTCVTRVVDASSVAPVGGCRKRTVSLPPSKTTPSGSSAAELTATRCPFRSVIAAPTLTGRRSIHHCRSGRAAGAPSANDVRIALAVSYAPTYSGSRNQRCFASSGEAKRRYVPSRGTIHSKPAPGRSRAFIAGTQRLRQTGM